MILIRYIILLLALLVSVYTNASDRKTILRDTRIHPLDIVFCLDLSGSTNGLIDDVREQLWIIINQAHAMEPAPDLRIGVVGFSRPSFGKENSYVKVLANLSADFDSVAYELYKLKPSVEYGDQYVSAALTLALKDMNWGKEQNNTKIIYVVGNGMASSRGVDIIKTADQLIKQHIIVNSLFVVSKSTNPGLAVSGWRKIAELTGGIQTEISIGKKEVVVDLDFNYNELIALNQQLNSTYLFHGDAGKENYRRLINLDSALLLSGLPNYYQRSWYKQSARFQNMQDTWDLVDYIKSPSGDLDKINIRTLTDSLQFYSAQQLRDLVLAQKESRDQIIRNMKLLFSNNFNQTYRQKFLSNELPDSNIFSRCVINILLKEWK